MSVYPPLLLSRTSEHEADVIWDDEQKSLALGGVTYEFAERVVACVNACKDISTEHLNQFPNWKLAVGNMARPGDVANLILKLGAYREALALVAGLLEDGDWRTATARAREALK